MRHSLFSVTGFEAEYMIVDDASLSIRPLSHTLLGTPGAPDASDAVLGDVTLSNEFFRHVIEMKVSQPAQCLWDMEEEMQNAIGAINRSLQTHGARLLPGGAHPFMNPATDAFLWDGEGREVYQRYAEIFDCMRHGWNNVQSIHINLPFDSDASFGTLHAAVRVLLPLLPALAASSPILEGAYAGALDARLFAYKDHQKRIPQTMGSVIPEPVFTEDEYREQILRPIADAVAPHNFDGVLRPEFMNARGAIARFDRSAIEIRLIDAQECLQADLSIAEIVNAVLRLLVEEGLSSQEAQKLMPTDALAAILWNASREGEKAVIDDEQFLRLFDFPGSSCNAHALWLHLLRRCGQTLHPRAFAFCSAYETSGPLARRILSALSGDMTHGRIFTEYRKLGDCLQEGILY